ncbi:sialin-like isoform X2 [Maniola hyperantus]|uniref:sialin-like isoform X2 n=1 Tax=Aphantopus hyperantus TaxID=2795564 RepID=UPI003748EA87
MCKIRVRAIVGIMIFLGYFLVYVVRYNLSVHIVDMVDIPKRLFEFFPKNETETLRTVLNSRSGGAMIPSMIQVLRHWVPPTERHHFMWAYCGITTGTFSTFLICAAVQYYFGWSVGFYISGAVQICWAVVWVLAVSDSPSKHAFISKEELSYLTTTIGTVFNIKLTNSQVPWKMILKSMTFWALCILNFGYAWMITSVCLHGPLYYTTILKYSIYEASALVALPFFLRLILGTIIIQIYHWYQYNKKVKRIKHMRKYFIVVSHVIPGFLVSMAWLVPVNPGPVLLTTAIVLTAAGMDLTLDICYSLSPNYVNPINTIIKIIGNLPGIIVSLCVGEVTFIYENTSLLVWRYVWCFHGTILLLSGLTFLLWGDIHVQPWNEIRRRPQKNRRVLVRPSVMSNITEMDEDDSSSRINISQRQKKVKNIRLSTN